MALPRVRRSLLLTEHHLRRAANTAAMQDSLPSLFAEICKAPKRVCCGQRRNRQAIAQYTAFWNGVKQRVLELPGDKLATLKGILGAQKLVVQYPDAAGKTQRKEV